MFNAFTSSDKAMLGNRFNLQVNIILDSLMLVYSDYLR